MNMKKDHDLPNDSYIALIEITENIEAEINKIEKAILDIKKSPRPNVDLMTMPERMKCYKDGLNYTRKVIKKYLQLEGLQRNE